MKWLDYENGKRYFPEVPNDDTIGCKLCNRPTRMLGTKLCDPCWELQRRIEYNPEMALKILAELNKTPLPPRRPATKIEKEAMQSICNMMDELEEARKVIRGLLTDLSPYTREQAILFLKQYE